MIQNKQKILVVCGPTGTGKTDLGIFLAKKFNGEIISADSRQVYKRMTIGTGKKYSDEVKIWGYDLVDPSEDFSVSHFQKYALEKIADINSRNMLPILVGGTGLYINSVIFDIETISIPVNNKLREELEGKTVTELFEILNNLDKERASRMNPSDSKNPRRLIRAIEVATSKTIPSKSKYGFDVLIIGLTSNIEYLNQRVDVSVDQRVLKNFEQEVKSIKENTNLNSKSLTATGYIEFLEYLNGEITKDEAIKMWKASEKQYIKRQITWFKKQKNINWFDILDNDYTDKVEKLVKTWDNKT